MARTNISSGLNEYQGNWSFAEARHLLNRTLFGAKLTEINSAVGDGLNSTINSLFSPNEAPNSPPITNSYHDNKKETAPLGKTWINEINVDNMHRREGLFAWTIGEMIEQNVSIRERMALFLYNHMPVTRDIYSGTLLYQYTNLLRDHYQSNLKTLVEKVCISPAMLRFLDGDDNRSSAPNENFARELLELFTIGKGPLRGNGDYTNYTESDVLSAAKVMTGWRVNQNTITSYFDEKRHDTQDKTFSNAFNNTVITGNGDQEYKQLIDMIFAQKEVARYFCRKLYRFFVHYRLDNTIEKNIIEPLADLLYKGNYELAPVYKKLFKSEHFFDIKIRGGLIKNPVEYTTSLYRTGLAILPKKTDYDKRFDTLKWGFTKVTTSLNMELGNPPSVAGWQAYYSAPLYHQKWIDSVTYPIRQSYAVSMTKGKSIGGKHNATDIQINFTQIKSQLTDISSTKLVVKECIALLLPLPLPVSAQESLEDIYTQVKKDKAMATIEQQLQALFEAIYTMPEYQLS